MHWKRLDRSSPSDGTVCVVGHFIKEQDKPIMGVWTYRYFGSDSYWETKTGAKIPCGKYDNWCNVDDIINVVGERIEDELRLAIENMRFRDGLYTSLL